MAGYSVPNYAWYYQGQVAAAGTMRVYVSGSTTLVNTFADGGLVTPLTNPVTLDANGQAVFYTDGTQLLRLDGYTANGTFIKSIDPVFPVPDLSAFSGSGVDLQKLVGITNGQATANKALVVDANRNIANLATNSFETWGSGVANMNAVMGSQGGGFINKFRNPVMDVNQYAIGFGAISTSGGFTVDGWYAQSTGANGSWSIAGEGSNPDAPVHAIQLVGATGCTDITFRQRIEGVIAGQLQSAVAVFQCEVYNATGASITPTITVQHAGTTDNWGAPVTDVNAVNVQACPNNTYTTIAYAFTVPSGAIHGLSVLIDFGNNFSSNAKSVYLSKFDLRAAQGMPVGQCTSPPVPEYRPYPIELAYNQRYLASFGDIVGVFGHGWAASTSGSGFIIPFKVPLRIAPTALVINTVADLEIATFAGADVAALTGLTFNSTYSSNQAAHVAATVSGTPLTAATAYMLYAKTALSGNLVFTGAEL